MASFVTASNVISGSSAIQTTQVPRRVTPQPVRERLSHQASSHVQQRHQHPLRQLLNELVRVNHLGGIGGAIVVVRGVAAGDVFRTVPATDRPPPTLEHPPPDRLQRPQADISLSNGTRPRSSMNRGSM